MKKRRVSYSLMAVHFHFRSRAWSRRPYVGLLSLKIWSLTTQSYMSTPCLRWSPGIGLKRSLVEIVIELIVARGRKMLKEEMEEQTEIEIQKSMDYRDEEMMRGELIKSIPKNWKNVVKLYEKDRRAHTIKVGESGSTALHMAVANAEEDIAEELVRLINEMNEDPLDVLSIKCGDLQSTPLHLAASFGSIRMCKCIVGTSTDHGQYHKQHMHKQLLGFSNRFSETPMYTAVEHAKKDTFLWLYELCDNSAQAYDYCHANHGITVLHVAIAGGYWDLAFQIIHRLEGLMDCVNDLGNSPLHILAQTANAFRSSINLSFFQNIIYNCIYVEKLIVSTTFKEKKKVKSLGHPNNYQTCFDFLQVPWKMIKLLGQHSSTRAQGRVSPTIYDKCLNFIGLVLSKLVDRSIILGSTEIRTLKEIKEMHVWSVQIMNKLLEHALRSEDEMNPQNDDTSEAQCYSEYGVFRRGKAFSTPILDAARNGIIEMVEKILQAFPMTIHDRTGDGMNTVLIAVEFRKSHIYDFLLRRRSCIVDKDLAFRKGIITGIPYCIKQQCLQISYTYPPAFCSYNGKSNGTST